MLEKDTMTLRELAELYKDQPMIKALNDLYEPTEEQRKKINEYNIFMVEESYNSRNNLTGN